MINFIKKKSALLLSLVVAVIIIVAASYPQEKFIMVDTSTATGDSVVSGWVYIGGVPNVALSYSVGDTTSSEFAVRYRYGTENHSVVTLAAGDTVTTVATTLVGKSAGKILRGYGLATDLIPGANFIYVKGRLITGGASYVKAALITAD